MSELEKKELDEIVIPENVKMEKLKYQKNSLSYMLGFAGIGCSILGAFMLLNSLAPGIYTIAKILLNIVILLFGFMCCENMKNYRIKAAYMTLGISAICVARIFFGPILLITNYAKYLTFIEDGVLDAITEKPIAEKWLGASILQECGFFNPSGYVRGTVAIVALAFSAAFFALAAVVCIKKTNALTKYMAENN